MRQDIISLMGPYSYARSQNKGIISQPVHFGEARAKVMAGLLLNLSDDRY